MTILPHVPPISGQQSTIQLIAVAPEPEPELAPEPEPELVMVDGKSTGAAGAVENLRAPLAPLSQPLAEAITATNDLERTLTAAAAETPNLERALTEAVAAQESEKKLQTELAAAETPNLERVLTELAAAQQDMLIKSQTLGEEAEKVRSIEGLQDFAIQLALIPAYPILQVKKAAVLEGLQTVLAKAAEEEAATLEGLQTALATAEEAATLAKTVLAKAAEEAATLEGLQTALAAAQEKKETISKATTAAAELIAALEKALNLKKAAAEAAEAAAILEDLQTALAAAQADLEKKSAKVRTVNLKKEEALAQAQAQVEKATSTVTNVKKLAAEGLAYIDHDSVLTNGCIELSNYFQEMSAADTATAEHLRKALVTVNNLQTGLQTLKFGNLKDTAVVKKQKHK